MEIFNHHVRDVDSCHTNARIQIECFLDQRHSVINIIQENCREMEVIYRVRVTTMFNTTHFFWRQGLPFRGHDEPTSSWNRVDFLELVQYA